MSHDGRRHACMHGVPVPAVLASACLDSAWLTTRRMAKFISLQLF